jgi:hypothetical protein
MATTTNFGWETPDDTDLVKDGAAAMRTLGNSIDTSFVDLKGGTTGQVLSKASNTDLDYTWVTTDDANAIQNAIVDAKGDLIAATAADTPARLAVGTNYYVLSAQSGETTGLKWAGARTAYTPTWTADGGSPSIGNGTFDCSWIRYGNLCHVRFYIQMGSTTNKGTGGWYFSLPFASSVFTTTGCSGSYYAEDFAVAGYRGIVGLVSDTTRFGFLNGAANSSLGATSPFTFNTSDYISGEFIYEVAA